MAFTKGPMKFNDVAVLFTEDEWSLLTDHQRALYMEVMKENYEHFIFLGYEVPVILSLLQDSSKELVKAGSRSSAPIPSAGRVSDASLRSHETTCSESSAAPNSLHNGGDSSHDENKSDLSPPLHNRNLRKRKQYFCPECESCFKHSSALEAHLRIHNGDKPHQCDICKETFSYRSALIVHRRQHPQPLPEPQHVPSVSPAIPVQTVKHEVVSSTPAPAPLPAITLTVQKAPTLSPTTNCGDHNIPSIGEKPLKCLYCDKRFNDPSILEAHHRIHTGKLAYPCTMCEASFSKPSLLAAHNNTHKEGKPFQCDQCDKNFNDQSLLMAHKRTHTGDKPHRCSHCNKWFLNRASLVAHEECHIKVKPYKCRHCEKSFNDKSLLITHEGVHTDTKPLKCTQCSESFFLRTQLIAHQLTHESEKPFPCSQCDRRFNKKETLLAHIRVHNLQTTQSQKPRRQ